MLSRKIYGLPSGEQMGTAAIGTDVNHSIFIVPQFSMINKAWLDKLGLDVPQTLDELYACLKAFKENDMSNTYYGNAADTTVPMSTGFDQWCWGQNIFLFVQVAEQQVVIFLVTKACKNPAALLKFYDLWYEPENTMQLQYGPKNVFFTGKDENGLWLSITEAEAKGKYGKGAGELKSTLEVAGPKLILADYYRTTFKMEDRAIERLIDLDNYWMQFVKSDTTYPVDCVYTKEELDIIDTYKTDFENTIAEYEGKWLKNGGPTDVEWEAYKTTLKKTCGLDELTKVYQDAYDRYKNNL